MWQRGVKKQRAQSNRGIVKRVKKSQIAPSQYELVRRAKARAIRKSSSPTGLNATYRYTAISATGQRVSSTMISPDSQSVGRALVSEGWTPLNIEKQSNEGMNLDIGKIFGGGGVKFKKQELADFARSLQQLVAAGLPLARAVASLGEEQRVERLKMCTALSESITSGSSLSKALTSYPAVFNEVFVSYVAAGEDTGTLAQSLDRLASTLERRAALSTKIKAVTAYPKMVSGAVGVIVLGIITFLVPQFAKIYEGFHAKLPGPTLALLSLSHMMNPIKMVGVFPMPNPTSPIVIGLLLIFAYKKWKKANEENLEIMMKLEKLKFKMPIFGKLNKKIALYQWASTLSGALSAGLQQHPALDLAGRSSGSAWHRNVSKDLSEQVQRGRALSDALMDHSELYPPNVRAMVATGEAAGELPAMLENVARTIDIEIDGVIAGLSAKIEVALLIVLGVVVGGILAVLYLPILQLSAVAGNDLENQNTPAVPG